MLFLAALVVMLLGQNCGWALQNVSAVPLGTTSEYCDDIVSTAELVYNLILGFDCNHSKPKARL
jgi:hypothetical protein